MKRYMLFLAGLMILAPYGEADAKAVKLGRGNSYSVAIDTSVNTSANETQVRRGECESNEECAADKKCMNYKCVDVCTQPQAQDGKSMARICNGKQCVYDPNGTPHTFTCLVDSCQSVTCKSGYTTEESSNGCCCVRTSCDSGQRLVNGECVDNCSGVKCATGYNAISKSDRCCCETSCSSGQIYNTTIKKCVDAVCPQGCLNDCLNGCNSCESGRYLDYSTGYCPTCSSAVANCATCSSKTTSSGGATCTKCSSGYYLSDGKCVTCPANATCNGTATITCKTGFNLSGKQCINDCNAWDRSYKSCSKGYRKPLTGSSSCTACPPNTECGTCPSGCSGSTAGSCSTSGTTCLMCSTALALPSCSYCSSGYKLTLDGTTCASLSGTGYDMAPQCR